MFAILSQQIMQIKHTLKFYLISVRMVQYEKTNVGEQVGKGKSSFIVSSFVNCCNNYRHQYESSLKLAIDL